MNIYYDPEHNTDVTIKMSYEEMNQLRYMLCLSFDKLLEDKIAASAYSGKDNVCDFRCQMNLDLRDMISDTIIKHNNYMDEQERKYE